ncbi:hypothetical protein E3P92_03274 [Wallemia ichthyophaga]|nr:hypothetical protein E3P92_03274 [Wallemia ichthyophaga]
MTHSPPNWIIQKFGGTSIGRALDSIVDHIVPQYFPASNVVLVCSARSGASKDTGTTNLLLKAATEALTPRNSPNSPSAPGTPGTPSALTRPRFGSPQQSRSASPTGFSHSNLDDSLRKLSLSRSTLDQPDFVLTANILREEHFSAARDLIKNDNVRISVEADISADCDSLCEFLNAAQIIDEISPRSKDAIVGLGERLACRLVCAALADRGIPNELVSLEGVVDAFVEGGCSSDDNNNTTLDQGFYTRLAQRLGERLRKCDGKVPVVTGFFGPVPGSLLQQVGRGYTDLCAALCAVGLNGGELQIWKEVDGIFTADPRKVVTARLVPIITPDEAAELTYYGSEVIHPFTMDQVIRASIPIRIKNVLNPLGPGTVIFPDANNAHDARNAHNPGEEASEAVKAQHSGIVSSKLPTAVTVKDNILVLNVHSNRKTMSHGFLAKIFTTLDRYGVCVDLISTSEVHVSMAIHGSNSSKRSFDRLVKELESIGTVDVHEDMAILSLVGRAMKHAVGIAGKMFSVLAAGNVNIEMISQGASEINISKFYAFVFVLVVNRVSILSLVFWQTKEATLYILSYNHTTIIDIPMTHLSVNAENAAKAENFANKLPSPHTATKLLSDPLALLPPILSVDDVHALLTPERGDATQTPTRTLSAGEKERLVNRALSEAVSWTNLALLDCVLGAVGRRWVNVDLRDNERTPMLVVAAASCWLDGIALLLGAGADPNASDSQSWTALHWSAINSHSQPDVCARIVALLLHHGASPLLTSSKGRTARDIAPVSNDIGELLDGAQEQAAAQSSSDLFSLSQASLTPSHTPRTKLRAREKKAARNTSILHHAADELGFDRALVHDAAPGEGHAEGEEEDEMELADGMSRVFDWSVCLPHQMLIINPDTLQLAIDALLALPSHPRPIAYASAPASALFLWQRYATHYGDPGGELSSLIFDHAVENIEQRASAAADNLPALAFWLHNVTLWLYFIGADGTLCEFHDMQAILADLLNEIHVFVVRLVERRLDALLDSLILDFNSMPELDDVRLDGEWRIVRALTRRKDGAKSPGKRGLGHRRNGGGSLSSSIFGMGGGGGSTSSFADIFNGSNNKNEKKEKHSDSLGPTSPASPRSPSFDEATKRRPISTSILPSDTTLPSSPSLSSLANAGNSGTHDTIGDKFKKINVEDIDNGSPKKLTHLLNSTLLVLEQYNVNEATIVQIFSQILYWTSSEVFNRVITNKRYFSRSRATMIRFNLSAIEEWVKMNKLPASIFNHHFAPLMQMLQWLGCLSAMTDFCALISTLQGLRQLNPTQLHKMQKEYRHEAAPVVESRMSAECVAYLDQLVQAWDSRRCSADSQQTHPTPGVPAKTMNHVDYLYPNSDSAPTQQNGVGVGVGLGLGLGVQPSTATSSSNSNINSNRNSHSHSHSATGDAYMPPPLPENFGEQVDSRYMLPFELPSDLEHLQWRRRKSAQTADTTDTPRMASLGALDDDLLSVPTSRPASRASSTHSSSPLAHNAHTAQVTITPDVPQDILTRIDNAVSEGVKR